MTRSLLVLPVAALAALAGAAVLLGARPSSKPEVLFAPERREVVPTSEPTGVEVARTATTTPPPCPMPRLPAGDLPIPADLAPENVILCLDRIVFGAESLGARLAALRDAARSDDPRGAGILIDAFASAEEEIRREAARLLVDRASRDPAARAAAEAVLESPEARAWFHEAWQCSPAAPSGE